ncbi:MAG: glycoside hydrolase family 13 protein [Parabacteroides sp.]|nr:glycoside hydrolase family 13 protein [Parabacteroides sp.]
MKKVFLSLFMLCALFAQAAEIERIEPACWWVDMKNPELQIMVYGKNIAHAEISIDYPGVRLKEVVRLESANYLFLYLDISEEAKAGSMNIQFTDGKQRFVQSYELRERNQKTGAQGFSPADVMYLITPDRFANADPKNDNLDSVKVDRSRSGARHGGDIRGIINKLDYIKDLGFTTIWLNPVLENRMPGGSYHGYAITDFYQVDPRFGSNEEYCELIDKAHDRGIKVVMDMIFNHCGSSHWWLKDFPSKDWLNHQDNFVQTTHFKWTLMDVHAPQSEKDILVNGWFTRGMPDLNQRNPHLARYLIQNSIWWIEYARIDGIRQDTHPYADYDFMCQWCKEVLEEYPDFNIVGEAWYPRGTASAWWQRGSKNNERDSHLKTVMDFDLTFTCEKAFVDECSSREGSEAGLFKLYEVIAQDFLFADPNNILIFLDNHDLGRFTRREEKDLNKFKQGLGFLLTTRGIPQIYYGTEILMSGTKGAGDGQIRADFPGGWEGDATNAFLESGRTPQQNEAFNYLKKLLHWRQQSEAVKHGSLIHYTPDRTGCYVYSRQTDQETVLVLMNGTDKEQTLQLDRFHEVIKGKTAGKDVISGQTIQLGDALSIPARGIYILDL